MPLTDDEYQQRIAHEFGTTDDEQFAVTVSYAWQDAADLYNATGYLRYLYAKQSVIEQLMAGQWQAYKWSEDETTEDPTAIFDKLQKLLMAAQAAIERAKQAQFGGQPLGGTIATQTPVLPDGCCSQRPPFVPCPPPWRGG